MNLPIFTDMPAFVHLAFLGLICGFLTPCPGQDIQSREGLAFASYGDRKLELDLYRPSGTQATLPAIVCIHGGGWYKGDRSKMTPLAKALAKKGFVTVTISYRLSGEAKFPAAIEDCKAAVRWLRANADAHGINPKAIGVTGLSAGGHLAALLATTGDVKELEGRGGHEEESSRVQACVAMGAQSDLESPRIQRLSSQPDDPFYRTFLGAPYSDMPAAYALASPFHHLDAGDPPLLFMTGELDDPSTRAEAMRSRMEDLQIPTGIKVLPRAPHAFLNQPAAFDEAVATCAQFFNTHLSQP